MGSPASRFMVRKLLKKHCLGQRKARKKKSLGAHPDRNAQFQNIAQYKADYLAKGWPVISIDTKKKELIGTILVKVIPIPKPPLKPWITIFPARVKVNWFRTVSMTWREMKAISTSIPASFVAIVLPIGGNSMAASIILMLCFYWYFAMVAVATPVIGLCLRKHCKSCPISLEWKSVSHTIHRIAQNTIPLSIGCFRTLRVFVRA